MKILFSQKAWEESVAWQNEDKKIVIKINALIKGIAGNGMLSGLGYPESLKHALSGLYSRRISQEHRLIDAQDVNGTTC